MDIEGAEPAALAVRARRSVATAQCSPCACTTSRTTSGHPLALAELCDGYRFHLRPHNEEGWDLICYAVPEERALVDSRGAHG